MAIELANVVRRSDSFTCPPAANSWVSSRCSNGSSEASRSRRRTRVQSFGGLSGRLRGTSSIRRQPRTARSIMVAVTSTGSAFSSTSVPISPGRTPSGYRDRRDVVSVQFSPPEGVRPGEIGTLVDEKADPLDVTATMIDLAVRGYLRIDEVSRDRPDRPPKDWTLVRLRDDDVSLLPFEHRLL